MAVLICEIILTLEMNEIIKLCYDCSVQTMSISTRHSLDNEIADV